MSTFTLVVVSTEDGFIARHPKDSPASWASAEEQALFFAEVDAADWSVMGRHTHEAADRPDRRRIVFSSRVSAPEWRRETQVWVNPEGMAPTDFPALVAHRRPLDHGLILGGTAVHDWFDGKRAIDKVLLTVEPIAFGAGLPLFTGAEGDPVRTLLRRGYTLSDERPLNAAGTRLLTFLRDDARQD